MKKILNIFLILGICTSIVSCVGFPERARFQYFVQDYGGLLVSTSPSYEKPVVQKEKTNLILRLSWLVKNQSIEVHVFDLKNSILSFKEQRIPIECTVGDEKIQKLVLKQNEKTLIACETKIEIDNTKVSSDVKASFVLFNPFGRVIISSPIYLRAEDFE